MAGAAMSQAGDLRTAAEGEGGLEKAGGEASCGGRGVRAPDAQAAAEGGQRVGEEELHRRLVRSDAGGPHGGEAGG